MILDASSRVLNPFSVSPTFPLYEVTEAARLEVGHEAHALQAPVAGRVMATRLVLNTDVQAGDVLVELDAEGERRRLAEEHANLAMLSSQLELLRKKVVAEEQAGQEAQRADQAALAKAQEEWRGAGADLSFAEEEVERWTRLVEKGYVAELDLLHAKEKAYQRRTRSAALRLEVSRREKEMRTTEKDRTVRLEHLHSEVSRLEGQRPEVCSIGNVQIYTTVLENTCGPEQTMFPWPHAMKAQVGGLVRAVEPQ
jgi:multidrug resistance efflux pump